MTGRTCWALTVRPLAACGLAFAFACAGVPLAFAQAAPVSASDALYPNVPFVANTTLTHKPEVGRPTDFVLRNATGTVVVAVLVGTDGAPQRFELIESDPPLIFDRHVAAAVPDFRFGIAMRNGKPIAYETRLTLHFAGP